MAGRSSSANKPVLAIKTCQLLGKLQCRCVNSGIKLDNELLSVCISDLTALNVFSQPYHHFDRAFISDIRNEVLFINPSIWVYKGSHMGLQRA